MTPPLFTTRPRHGGFTLVEITLGAALTAVVGLVVFSTFSSGLKLWQRHQEGSGARDTALLFERMQRDLENGSPYAEWDMRGNLTQCEFPAFVRFVAGPGQEHLAPGRILYFWDEARSQVWRSVSTLSEGRRKRAGPSSPASKSSSSHIISSTPAVMSPAGHGSGRPKRRPCRQGSGRRPSSSR